MAKSRSQPSKTQPGVRNLITDVDGVTIANAHDEKVRTGVTVVLTEDRAVAACDIRGGGPGTRETEALDPACLVDAIDAVVLSGGSVYGLEAASGVVNWLGARGRGYQLGTSNIVAPIVPSAILFDLANEGDKAWGEDPPYRALGRAACEAATTEFKLGNSGAGYGARAGQYKGGLGSASTITPDGLQVGALVAVNSFGSPIIPGTKALWAQAFAQGDEMGPLQSTDGLQNLPLDLPEDTKLAASVGPGANTTIGVIATNAVLTPAEAQRVAIMAQDGYARAVRPIHTAMDGDSVFVMATGRHTLAEPAPLNVSRIGMIAADCLTRAIGRGVWAAESLGDIRAVRDI